LLVTGGRLYTKSKFVSDTMDAVMSLHELNCVIVGDARGADDLARQYCVMNNVPFVTFIAQWKLYGKGAGHARNVEMCEADIHIRKYLNSIGMDMSKYPYLYSPIVGISFPGGAGTANCVSNMDSRNIPNYHFDDKAYNLIHYVE